MIKQRKLINSIVLVEFKSVKWHYVVGLIITGVFLFFTSLALGGVLGLENTIMSQQYSFAPWQTTLIYVVLLFLLLAIALLLIMLIAAKSAIVDKGIYITLNYLHWYNVHDYIINEITGKVVLTTCRETFSTLRGTTVPLKVVKEDMAKLKFILDKNKNKFSR